MVGKLGWANQWKFYQTAKAKIDKLDQWNEPKEGHPEKRASTI
jgi:hypothetical protein